MGYSELRHRMVESQIRTMGVNSPTVLAAFEEVPREKFVSQEIIEFAYIDDQVDIGDGRMVLEPLVIALILQALTITKDSVVLEVGSGTGYVTSLLSLLGGTIVALEINEGLASKASENLLDIGMDNVLVVNESMVDGYKKQAPYDIIFFSGGAEFIPDNIINQLADGGRLGAVVPSADSLGKGIIIQKFGDSITKREIFSGKAKTLPGFGKIVPFSL